ncbi:Splicing coactivator SRm160/300, subunit SRm160 (contains PWI domain) [Ceraceosorus bombacis]|uniref:Splicing coactivator SRm160/300, subunit SRm160 (Contains PWI domain) n=1 Tax=Ceraceosorus bombacis TaxID=401625 RepID=A0A0P1B9K6_9BASI|nr:Splicing coactivator SRm160/300, subunit SRm160 (contains PWI domain) [Ceraceosorus bombacis]
MGDSGYRGISASHADARFAGKEQKAISLLQSQGKFPASFAQKVDLRKVNLEVIRPWVEDKTKELLGFDDDVVAEYAMGMLENTEEKIPDPKKLQLSLTGFLESKTPDFMASLWDLLLDAQASIGGIPSALVQQKKAELAQARAADAQALSRAGLTGAAGRGRGGGRGSARDHDRRVGPASFKDKSGNLTEKVQDSGWGARARGSVESARQGPPEASASDRRPRSRWEGLARDEGRSWRDEPRGWSGYHDDSSSGRPYAREYRSRDRPEGYESRGRERSFSPPRHRDGRRSYDRPKSRSRSMSVTPEYDRRRSHSGRHDRSSRRRSRTRSRSRSPRRAPRKDDSVTPKRRQADSSASPIYRRRRSPTYSASPPRRLSRRSERGPERRRETSRSMSRSPVRERSGDRRHGNTRQEKEETLYAGAKGKKSRWD